MTTDPGVRRFDPPRPVEVLHGDQWVRGVQLRWTRWPDGEWRAFVEYVVQHSWGRGKHVRSVPADRVRPAPESPRAAPSGPAAPPTTGRM